VFFLEVMRNDQSALAPMKQLSDATVVSCRRKPSE